MFQILKYMNALDILLKWLVAKAFYEEMLPKNLRETRIVMVTSHGASTESATSMRMTIDLLNLAFQEETVPMCSYKTGHQGRRLRKGIQLSSEVIKNKSKFLRLSPFSWKISEHFLVILRWERWLIRLWGPLHCLRKIAPYVPKLPDEVKHNVSPPSTCVASHEAGLVSHGS